MSCRNIRRGIKFITNEYCGSSTHSNDRRERTGHRQEDERREDSVYINDSRDSQSLRGTRSRSSPRLCRPSSREKSVNNRLTHQTLEERERKSSPIRTRNDWNINPQFGYSSTRSDSSCQSSFSLTNSSSYGKRSSPYSQHPRTQSSQTNRTKPEQQAGLLPTPVKPPLPLFSGLVFSGTSITFHDHCHEQTHVQERPGLRPSSSLTRKALLPTPSVCDSRQKLVPYRKGPATAKESRTLPEKRISNGGKGQGTESDGNLKNPAVAQGSVARESPRLIPFKPNERDTVRDRNYDGISKQYLFCHFCIEHLRDGPTFENHLKKSSHLSLVQTFRTNYEIQLELLRHNALLQEKQRGVELEHGTQIIAKECSVCQIRYDGDASVHEKSTHHQRLERFLRPRCSVCQCRFGTRLERDFHRLSAAHLRKLQELEKSAHFQEILTDSHVDPDCVNDTDIVGHVTIEPVTAFYCRVCHLFFPTKNEAYGVHCRSASHLERYRLWLDVPAP